MNFSRSSNPTLSDNTFISHSSSYTSGQTMTLQGTVNKSILMVLLIMLGAAYTWQKFMAYLEPASGIAAVTPYIWGGAIGGLIIGLIIAFKHNWAPFLAPIYAIVEGLFLGALSAMFEAQFPGIVMRAVMLTMGTFFALLFVYKSRIIKVTDNFRLGVAAATGGIFFVYLLSWILGMFGVNMGFMYDSSPLSIIISLVVIVVAALNLVMDFDFIEKGAAMNVPKYMEWYAAFGLIVTLVWLYIEFLRLLSKLQSRN